MHGDIVACRTYPGRCLIKYLTKSPLGGGIGLRYFNDKGGMMYISERRYDLIDGHQSESDETSPLYAVRSLRIVLLMGFLIVLSIEGWLLIKVLVN